MEEEKKENKLGQESKYKYALIGGLIGGAVAVVAILSILFFGLKYYSKKYQNSQNSVNNTANNTASISEYNGGGIETYETEHIIEDVKLKFTPPTDMLILSKSEIEQFMGQGFSDLYEVVSMNETGEKLLYIFKIADDTEQNHTADEYIDKSLNTSEHSAITKETIGGLEFSKAEVSRKDEDKEYTEVCYVYKYDNKFLCIDYWHSADTENIVPQVFTKVE